MAELFCEDAQAEPRCQNALEDAGLALGWKRHQSPSQLGNFGVLGLGGQAQDIAYLNSVGLGLGTLGRFVSLAALRRRRQGKCRTGRFDRIDSSNKVLSACCQTEWFCSDSSGLKRYETPKRNPLKFPAFERKSL
jgi:hypothetical protein